MQKFLYGAALALALSGSAATAETASTLTLGASLTQAVHHPMQSPGCNERGFTNVSTACEGGCDIKWKVCTATLGGLPSNDPQVVRCRTQLRQCLSQCN